MLHCDDRAHAEHAIVIPARSTAFAPAVALAAAQAVLLGLWLLAYIAARALEYAPHASLWFPPAAVTFAGWLVFGVRALPALAVACFVATWSAAGGALSPAHLAASALLFAAGHCLAFGGLAAVVRHALRSPDPARSLLRPVTVFLVGGSAAAMLAAAIGAIGLGQTALIDRPNVFGLIVPWAIGDYAGLVSLGPLVAVLLRRLAIRWNLPSLAPPVELHRDAGNPDARVFAGKLAILLAITTLVLLATAWLPQQPPIVFTLFLAIIVQSWIVHTQRIMHSLCSIAMFALIIAALTAVLHLDRHALVLQFAMLALAANSYFGMAVPDLYADNARLRRLMSYDALTGAWTRAFFIEQARAGLQEAGDRGEPAALVMIDLDELKLINDLHGHAAGDRALALLVGRCRSALGSRQIIGRLSGDEFCVFLPGADRVAAMQRVAAMRQALMSIDPDALPHRLQASFGIAVLEQPGESYETLLSRADQAMYAVKHSGRRDEALPAR